MDARRFVLLLILGPLGLCALCGCKSDPYMDAYLETVNAEKRSLEETIYDLRYENEKLRKRMSKGQPISAEPEDDNGGFGPLVTPPGHDDPGQSQGAPFVEPPVNPDLSEPMTSPGKEVDPSEIFPSPTTSAQVWREEPASPTSVELTRVEVAGADEPVTHLHINRSATRGRNTDGKNGDDVLMVGLELRDKYGRFVPSASPISLVLLDPQLKGAEARIAEWHFDANQVAVGARHAGATPMILLEASWPKRPPKHSRLQLWARYTSPDGRILQTKELIHISVDGQFSTRWTPRQRNAAARVATRPDKTQADWTPNR